MLKKVLLVTVIIIIIYMFPESSSVPIKISGSASVAQLTKEIIDKYKEENSSAEFIMTDSSIDDAFSRFCKGKLDIVNTTRDINAVEMRACRQNAIKYNVVPLGIEAMTLIVNIRNTAAPCLAPEQIRGIWGHEDKNPLTKWNQIVASAPEKEIVLYILSNGDGTQTFFEEEMLQHTLPTGKVYEMQIKKSAIEVSNIDELLEKISTSLYSMTYLTVPVYLKHKDKFNVIAIKNVYDSCTLPSKNNIVFGNYDSLQHPLKIYYNRDTFAPDTNAYDFLTFYRANSAQVVKDSGYLPPK